MDHSNTISADYASVYCYKCVFLTTVAACQLSSINEYCIKLYCIDDNDDDLFIEPFVSDLNNRLFQPASLPYSLTSSDYMAPQINKIILY